MRKGVFLIWLLLSACSSRDPAPLPAIKDYLPMRSGDYRIYAVDSVVVNQNVETEFTYEVKTTVVDSFPSSGGYTWVVQRSMRKDLNALWRAMDTWSFRMDAFQSVVSEGNTPFVWLAGPLTIGKTWNGNAYNDLGGAEKCAGTQVSTCDNYSIQTLGAVFQVPGGVTYPNTLTVLENNNNDLIVSFDKRQSVYAKQLGLVYHEVTQLEYCTAPSCLGTQFVDKGLRYTQRILESGH